MSITYLKKAAKTSATDEASVQSTVQGILNEIEAGGEDVAKAYSAKLDKWNGDIVVSDKARVAAIASVSQATKDDLIFAHGNVKRFAESQLGSISDTRIEVSPGVTAGHKNIPLHTAGCYVPGGRYCHVASAIMSTTTAKVAGVKNIVACSPPRPGVGVDPAVVFALDLCGADTILNLGGVQGVAAMAFGLFGNPAADILVGPGNQFVAEAKRILFGRIAIDMFAGPTESMVIADSTADADIVAWDLAGQAEHGYNSPVWLVTLDRALADNVAALIPGMIDSLPELNRVNAEAAWRDYGEIILCDTREEAVQVSDQYASEHLQVQCDDLNWWFDNLSNYGSLFLGEETTVAFGDKCSGPNHILPTKGAGRYTGGLSVGKFLKTVTWQRMTREANLSIGPSTARISRLEGMEGHARTADIRLEKWFPDTAFNLAPATE